MTVSKHTSYGSVVDIGAGLTGLATLTNGSSTTGTPTNTIENHTNLHLLIDIFAAVTNSTTRTAGARLTVLMETDPTLSGTYFEWEQPVVLGNFSASTSIDRKLFMNINIPPGRTRIKSVTNNTGGTLSACTIEARPHSVDNS